MVYFGDHPVAVIHPLGRMKEINHQSQQHEHGQAQGGDDPQCRPVKLLVKIRLFRQGLAVNRRSRHRLVCSSYLAEPEVPQKK